MNSAQGNSIHSSGTNREGTFYNGFQEHMDAVGVYRVYHEELWRNFTTIFMDPYSSKSKDAPMKKHHSAVFDDEQSPEAM
ncbi:MAG: hypothetical protein Q9162_003661 [Coniocarpon cinnabarinum]